MIKIKVQNEKGQKHVDELKNILLPPIDLVFGAGGHFFVLSFFLLFLSEFLALLSKIFHTVSQAFGFREHGDLLIDLV